MREAREARAGGEGMEVEWFGNRGWGKDDGGDGVGAEQVAGYLAGGGRRREEQEGRCGGSGVVGKGRMRSLKGERGDGRAGEVWRWSGWGTEDAEE
eukprot:2894331-Rhodomonas_salina.1